MDKNIILKSAEKMAVKIVKKSAYLEANTACIWLAHQPKEPQEVKKLRKF